MSETNNRSGLFVGVNHGRVVTRPAKQGWKTRPATRKGNNSKRVQAVKSVIREVAGFSPLEKKMLELIRTGVATKEKKAVKIARAKLGTQRRAQLARENIHAIIASQRKK